MTVVMRVLPALPPSLPEMLLLCRSHALPDTLNGGLSRIEADRALALFCWCHIKGGLRFPFKRDLRRSRAHSLLVGAQWRTFDYSLGESYIPVFGLRSRQLGRFTQGPWSIGHPTSVRLLDLALVIGLFGAQCVSRAPTQGLDSFQTVLSTLMLLSATGYAYPVQMKHSKDSSVCHCDHRNAEAYW